MAPINSVSRRGFIRTGAIGAGALALAPALSALAANKPQKKLGVAIVGLGTYAGGQIAPALLKTKDLYLAGLVSGKPAKAAEWATKYNVPPKNIYNYENFDEIAKNPDIDIVYVILPVALHKEYVIRAAKAGKHVICEKPMAVTAKDCEEMIAACKKANRLLSIGYRSHFDPRHQSIMNLDKKGFGKVISFESGNGFVYNQDPKAWRLNKALAGGGALMDMGVYTIQAARYTMGMEPIAVTATQQKLKPELFPEVDETIDFVLEFPNGFKAKCRSSYNDNIGYVRATTEKGLVEINPAFYYNNNKGKTPNGPMDLPQVNQQAGQMDDFAACINQKKQSSVSGELGLKDIKVVEAIYRALDSGKREKIV